MVKLNVFIALALAASCLSISEASKSDGSPTKPSTLVAKQTSASGTTGQVTIGLAQSAKLSSASPTVIQSGPSSTTNATDASLLNVDGKEIKVEPFTTSDPQELISKLSAANSLNNEDEVLMLCRSNDLKLIANEPKLYSSILWYPTCGAVLILNKMKQTLGMSVLVENLAKFNRMHLLPYVRFEDSNMSSKEFALNLKQAVGRSEAAIRNQPNMSLSYMLCQPARLLQEHGHDHEAQAMATMCLSNSLPESADEHLSLLLDAGVNPKCIFKANFKYTLDSLAIYKQLARKRLSSEQFKLQAINVMRQLASEEFVNFDNAASNDANGEAGNIGNKGKLFVDELPALVSVNASNESFKTLGEEYAAYLAAINAGADLTIHLAACPDVDPTAFLRHCTLNESQATEVASVLTGMTSVTSLKQQIALNVAKIMTLKAGIPQ